MPTTTAKPARAPTPRSIAAKAAAAEKRARRLHTIAERRGAAQGMDKATFIAEIVKGNFRPITAEDIANEPDPE